MRGDSRLNRCPAVIVFAREPVAGGAKTRLIPLLGGEAAARLAGAFIVDALAKAARIGNSRLVLAGTATTSAHSSSYFQGLARRYGAELIDQGRGHLGRRMARVLTRYARAGAILMGTDTPSVPFTFLRQALEDLREAPVVIAPALDGGYYLVGTRGPVPDIFRRMDWGGNQVMRQSLQRLRRLKVSYRLGRWWYDIDRPGDVWLLSADLMRMGHRRSRSACPATAAVLRELGILKRRRLSP